MDYHQPQETLARYKQLLLQHYKLNEENDSYVAVVEKRATVSWWLKACDSVIGDLEVFVRCDVEPLQVLKRISKMSHKTFAMLSQ